MFRCKFVASEIVAAFDDRRLRSPGVKDRVPGRDKPGVSRAGGKFSRRRRLFGVTRRLQSLDLMTDLRADRYVAPAVRASWRSCAVSKSP